MLHEIYLQIMLEAVQEIMQIFKIDMAKELQEQGHKNTGGLSGDLDIVIEKVGNKITGKLLIRDYGKYVDSGVSADNIPYTIGGRGNGGTSKYIQGLIDWWQSKGLQIREAKSAAFATATIHKREGMPTRGSYKYSKNGRRKGFIGATIQSAEPKAVELLKTKVKDKIIIRIKQPLIAILKAA